MVNINFVPEDYVQKRESKRANWLYLGLFLILMSALGGTFMILKMRQAVVSRQAAMINAEMAKARESISQFEKLQEKRKSMMKTALTTASLIEPIPRSILLAELTNNLPEGVSLQRLRLSSRTPRPGMAAEKSDEDFIFAIEGFAPSDKEVAAYIESLDLSRLFSNVSLIMTKEYNREKKKSSFREFKLQATLNNKVKLTAEIIDNISGRKIALTENPAQNLEQLQQEQ